MQCPLCGLGVRQNDDRKVHAVAFSRYTTLVGHVAGGQGRIGCRGSWSPMTVRYQPAGQSACHLFLVDRATTCVRVADVNRGHLLGQPGRFLGQGVRPLVVGESTVGWGPLQLYCAAVSRQALHLGRSAFSQELPRLKGVSSCSIGGATRPRRPTGHCGRSCRSFSIMS